MGYKTQAEYKNYDLTNNEDNRWMIKDAMKKFDKIYNGNNTKKRTKFTELQTPSPKKRKLSSSIKQIQQKEEK